MMDPRSWTAYLYIISDRQARTLKLSQKCITCRQVGGFDLCDACYMIHCDGTRRHQAEANGAHSHEEPATAPPKRHFFILMPFPDQRRQENCYVFAPQPLPLSFRQHYRALPTGYSVDFGQESDLGTLQYMLSGDRRVSVIQLQHG